MTTAKQIHSELIINTIYQQHDKHFARVRAAAVLFDGVHVANISIKYPQDGAGRLYAYVHLLGLQMQRGTAIGYGYDKGSAAVQDAARKYHNHNMNGAGCLDWQGTERDNVPRDAARVLFVNTLRDIGGASWYDALRAVGFTVLNVI